MVIARWCRLDQLRESRGGSLVQDLVVVCNLPRGKGVCSIDLRRCRQALRDQEVRIPVESVAAIFNERRDSHVVLLLS